MSDNHTLPKKPNVPAHLALDNAPDNINQADLMFSVPRPAKDAGHISAPAPQATAAAHGRQGNETAKEHGSSSSSRELDDDQKDIAIEKSIDERRLVLSNRNVVIIVGTNALVALLFIFWIYRSPAKLTSDPDAERIVATNTTKSEAATTSTTEEPPGEVVLPTEARVTSGIEIEGVTERPAIARLSVTGSVEATQQGMQSVTPLVAGRIGRVFAAVGDHVRAGSLLATIESPQIAEMRGNLSAAQTRLTLAERNLARVQRSENRVAVLSAKAKLDEAEATLRRTRRLIDLGAGAGKDFVAAEAAYKTAKAEYDFQSNIALNREVQEAQAAVETARTEVAQIRNGLSALGASAGAALVAAKGGPAEAVLTSTAQIAVRASASGTVTERFVNEGAGVEMGKPLFTIANISTVWVIANVPEAQIGSVRTGAPAEITSDALAARSIVGRVSYIDPVLSEETRTERVRVEVANPGERLKVGMFVEVGFQTSPTGSGTAAAGGTELVVPAEAVQRVGDRSVVFIPKTENGHYEVREVQTGGEVAGYSRITGGLKLGDRVVTKGGFLLKSQLLKGSFGEEDEK